MKKIGLITIIDNDNYGNRLQNFAIYSFLKEKGFEVETINNKPETNDKKRIIIRNIKKIIESRNKKKESIRNSCFKEFNSNINFSRKKITAFSNIDNRYDYFIVGSDQVWNPNFGRLRDVDLLNFTKLDKKISFSASYGISELPEQYKTKTKKALSTFKAISVREDAGKVIVEELTNRTDVEVLVDPTMLLTAEEWDKVSKRPKQLDNLKNDKYILNYFLGKLSEGRKKEIERVARENDCEIINILDKNSPFYQTGPSEFLYLEKNAFLICTDSFHSSVFAILYDRPFIIFNREDRVENMNSRIETLIKKFNLKDREFIGEITNKNLNHDYTEAYKILKKEREKANNFLKKALN